MQWFYPVIACLMLENSDMLVIKNMQNGKYIQSSALTTFKNVGPQMCIRKCARYSGCNAINYKWTQLYCELLDISSTDLGTSTIADSEFSYCDISSSEVVIMFLLSFQVLRCCTHDTTYRRFCICGACKDAVTHTIYCSISNRSCIYDTST